VLGVPNGFNNLGLQATLYEHAPADQIGAVGGQCQTLGYLGAIFSTALPGLVFGDGTTSAGLHTLAGLLVTISVLLVVASFTMGRVISSVLSPPGSPAPTTVCSGSWRMYARRSGSDELGRVRNALGYVVAMSAFNCCQA
jgi:hypothetical protein